MTHQLASRHQKNSVQLSCSCYHFLKKSACCSKNYGQKNIKNWTLHWTSTANRSQICSICLLVLVMTREIKWGNLQFYKNWSINVHYIHSWFQHLGLYSYLDVFVQFIGLETLSVWLTLQQKWEKFLQHIT